MMQAGNLTVMLELLAAVICLCRIGKDFSNDYGVHDGISGPVGELKRAANDGEVGIVKRLVASIFIRRSVLYTVQELFLS